MNAAGLADAGVTVNVADAREVPRHRIESWVTPLLNDPRDVPFVALMAECTVVVACGVGLFFAGHWLWYVAPFYWLGLILIFLDRFTLMLHCTSHRPLFKPKYRRLNEVIPWVLGPFFGQTPDTYFAHHMGMHHSEENLPEDLSSTMQFQRDKFTHWLKYWSRFLTIGLPELLGYMKRKGRQRLSRRIIVGEGLYWAIMVALAIFRPGAVVVVFVVPLVIIRTLMMMGNWGQHAFIAENAPENPYLASITCINSVYNRRCFNDGYHIGHHLQARSHWTEYPVEFETNIAEYGRQDAIVFEGLDFFMVWLLLMTKQWSRLARAYVRLPGAPLRDEAQIIALFKERMRPFPTA